MDGIRSGRDPTTTSGSSTGNLFGKVGPIDGHFNRTPTAITAIQSNSSKRILEQRHLNRRQLLSLFIHSIRTGEWNLQNICKPSHHTWMPVKTKPLPYPRLKDIHPKGNQSTGKDCRPSILNPTSRTILNTYPYG